MATARKPARKVQPVDEKTEKATIMVNALSDMPLKEWEQGFIESIYDVLITKGYKLTEKQFDKLEEVYRRYF